jgi:hypothetical protein
LTSRELHSALTTTRVAVVQPDGGSMTDRIISSRTHDAHMTVVDHIADGWVASVCVVRKGLSKGTEVIKLDTIFEREDVAWASVETLARAELNNLK